MASFDPPQVIVQDKGGVPWISDDLLTLFFEDTSTNQGISATQRKTPDDPFEVSSGSQLPSPLDRLGDPYVVGGANGRLYMSSGFDIEVSSLQDWHPGGLSLVGSPGDAPSSARPTPTPDELTLYFVSDAAVPKPLDQMETWVAFRASVDAPFDTAVPVEEVNKHAYTFPSWISPDGCRLYFDAGNVAGSRDLYMAERR